MTFAQIKWWLLLLFSIILTVLLIPGNIAFTLNENINRYQAEQISRSFLQKNSVELENYQPVVTREVAYNTLTYLNKNLGTDKLNQIIDQDRIPDNRWQIRYVQNLPTDQPQTTYHVWVSSQGNIIGYSRQLPDTLTMASEIEARALALARFYITSNTDFDLNQFTMKKSQQSRQLNRTDYIFVWEKPAGFSDGTFRLTVYVQGNELGGYEYTFILPEEIQSLVRNKTTQGTFYYFIQFMFLILVSVLSLVIFLRKYHEGEVSVSLGRNLFIIIFSLGLLGAINEYPVSGTSISMGNLSFPNTQLLVFFYEVLIKNSFLGVLLLTSWAVGEAYARRYAPEKLNSIDSVLNKRFFTLSTGTALLRGGSIGFLLAALYLAYLMLVTGKNSDIAQAFFPVGDSMQHLFPFITIIKSTLISALISEVVFRFFIINVIYNKWRKKSLAILFSALAWTGVVFILSNFPQVSDYGLTFFTTFTVGIFLAWLYFKYDLLTLIAINVSAQIVFLTVPLAASPNQWHTFSFYALLLLLLIPALIIVISYIKRDEFQYSYTGLPAHIARISERERMQKELEIAQNVQIGLLPKSNPQISGFDIAGACRPAKEVGGDYFDFIHLSDKKLGIAIGDVSGKGVPAAIYMTLTKGILQSHGDDNVSPKLVLSKVNRLLYRNIEKNSFVSMFYAILDAEASTLTFARAGHNPGIMINQKDGSNNFLSTDGIALGLEEGAIFENTLQEQTITLIPGSTLVFYTDGFTEAMNNKQQEFGEEAFLQTITEHHHLSAENLINKLLEKIEQYAGSYPQHDDMTVIILKILR